MLADTILQNIRTFSRKTFCHLVQRNEVTDVSWHDLGCGIQKFVKPLRESGAAPGSVVLIFLPHCPDLLYSFAGALFSGLVPSFMPCPSGKQDPNYYWKSHAALIERIRPQVIITDRDQATQMRASGLELGAARLICVEELSDDQSELIAPANVVASDIALLQHSSGTTGLKKGVALSHAAVEAQLEAYARAIKLEPTSCIVSWLPLYHDMGLIACFLLPMCRGVELVFLDAFRWVVAPHQLFEYIEKFSGTHVWLPNFAFEHLAKNVSPERKTYNLASMKAYIGCSEVCRAETFSKFESKFSCFGVTPEQLQVCYAMAESVFAATQTELSHSVLPTRFRAESLDFGCLVEKEPISGKSLLPAGKPVPGANIRIVNESRETVADGVVGEISLNGDFMFAGYYALPEKTNEHFVDNWYYTRDIGFVFDDQLYVLGRRDDLIIVNGRNYYSHELEAIIGSVPGVKPGRVVTFGVFNEGSGSLDAVALVETELAAEPAAVNDQLKRDIKQLVLDQTGLLVAEVQLHKPGYLAKTTSGKMSRELNRERYLKNKMAV